MIGDLAGRFAESRSGAAIHRRPAIPAPGGNREESLSPTPSDDTSNYTVVVGGDGFNFHEWEEFTRGSEDSIRQKQQAYLRQFAGCEGPVLDAGCGRGEFLELLRGAGLASYGIDLDDAMVAWCREKGLHAEKAELLAHLRQLPDSHLGGVFAGQIVEHLPVEALASFCALLREKLRPGGVAVIETINPECLTVFSGAFYADPTHTKPVHPKALEFLMVQAGLEWVEKMPVSPFAEEDKLPLLREESPLPPEWKRMLLTANESIARLNDLLYKPADYAAVVRRPL
jgi:O-antigen chain-terminating methyltransferase